MPVEPLSYVDKQNLKADPRMTHDPEFRHQMMGTMPPEDQQWVEKELPLSLEGKGRWALQHPVDALTRTAGNLTSMALRQPGPGTAEGVADTADWARENPGKAGAAAAVIGGPATGGLSWIPGLLTAMGYGGFGSLMGRTASEAFDPETNVKPTGFVDRLKQPAIDAGEQGVAHLGGTAAMKLLTGGGNLLMDSVIPAAPTFRKQFRDLAPTLNRNAINPMVDTGVTRAEELLTKSRGRSDEMRRLFDAQRPEVSGLIGGGTYDLPLGTPPKPSGGAPVVLPAPHAPGWRQVDPVGFDPLGAPDNYYVYNHPSQRLGGEATDVGPQSLFTIKPEAPPTPTATPDVVAGPGVIRRPVPPEGRPISAWPRDLSQVQDVPHPGGAPPTMIDPQELLLPLNQTKMDLANRALPDAEGELQKLIDRFSGKWNKPITTAQNAAIKRAEQDLANNAYSAELRGAPVNPVDTNFHQGIATGAQMADERLIPGIADVNKETQSLIGAHLLAQNASATAPKFPSLKSVLFGAGAASSIPVVGPAIAAASMAAGVPRIAAPVAIQMYKLGQIDFSTFMRLMATAVTSDAPPPPGVRRNRTP